MGKKSETVTLKKTVFVTILAIFGIIIAVFAGYFVAVQTIGTADKSGGSGDSDTGASAGGASGDSGLEKIVTREGLFVTYAENLGLNKKQFESCLNSGKYATQVDDDFKLGVSIGVTGTPTFVVNGRAISGAIPYASFSEELEKELKSPTNRTLATSLMRENDPVLGNSNAPIVMLEFSDFQCPFCGKFRSESFDSVKKNYIDTGKVYFVYKDFPLKSIHALAQKAAESALCAKEQGKFWEYHDKLFANQIYWAR